MKTSQLDKATIALIQEVLQKQAKDNITISKNMRPLLAELMLDSYVRGGISLNESELADQVYLANRNGLDVYKIMNRRKKVLKNARIRKKLHKRKTTR